MVKFYVGEDSCSSQTTKESTLLVAQSLFVHRLSAETLSPAKGREVQQSFERSCPRAII